MNDVKPPVPASVPSWTFLSNHAHVLLLIARDHEIKLRDAALQVGITERAVQRIVADLEAARYLERHREGRRNHYRIHRDLPLRHPIESQTLIGELLGLLLAAGKEKSGTVRGSQTKGNRKTK